MKLLLTIVAVSFLYMMSSDISDIMNTPAHATPMFGIYFFTKILVVAGCALAILSKKPQGL